jgi:hypothetical protein
VYTCLRCLQHFTDFDGSSQLLAELHAEEPGPGPLSGLHAPARCRCPHPVISNHASVLLARSYNQPDERFSEFGFRYTLSDGTRVEISLPVRHISIDTLTRTIPTRTFHCAQPNPTRDLKTTARRRWRIGRRSAAHDMFRVVDYGSKIDDCKPDGRTERIPTSSK